MELIEIKNLPGVRVYGAVLANRAYVIVEDLYTGEFTASAKLGGTTHDRTHYILDYGEGVKTLEEAKEAVLKYHKKVLS